MSKSRRTLSKSMQLSRAVVKCDADSLASLSFLAFYLDILPPWIFDYECISSLASEFANL